MTLSKRLAEELQNIPYEPFHVTEDGLARLKEKLARLKKALPDLAAEAGRTAAYGDRSENDEYKIAKGALRRTKGQILRIEDQIKRAVVIKSGASASGVVQIGSTVMLKARGEKKIFQIVGPHETDPSKGRISFQSPLGAALLSHRKGDTVLLKMKDASQSYFILEVR